MVIAIGLWASSPVEDALHQSWICWRSFLPSDMLRQDREVVLFPKKRGQVVVSELV